MTLKPLRTGQPAVRGGAPLDGDLYRWLASLVTAVNFAIPPKGIVMAYLTAVEVAAYFDGTGLGNRPGPYEDWALCNGSNGTPNLASKFMRVNNAGDGTTGGSDSSAHTHAIDHDHGSFTSAAESGHTHAIDHDHGSFTSGAGSAHSHTAGSLVADIAINNNDLEQLRVSASFTANRVLTGADNAGAASSTAMTVATQIDGTSATESAHTHAVDVPALTGTSGASSGHTHSIDVPSITATSGAASATDNRPAYQELVALMRLDRSA